MRIWKTVCKKKNNTIYSTKNDFAPGPVIYNSDYLYKITLCTLYISQGGEVSPRLLFCEKLCLTRLKLLLKVRNMLLSRGGGKGWGGGGFSPLGVVHMTNSAKTLYQSYLSRGSIQTPWYVLFHNAANSKLLTDRISLHLW